MDQGCSRSKEALTAQPLALQVCQQVIPSLLAADVSKTCEIAASIASLSSRCFAAERLEGDAFRPYSTSPLACLQIAPRAGGKGSSHEEGERREGGASSMADPALKHLFKEVQTALREEDYSAALAAANKGVSSVRAHNADEATS